jgi:peptidoglycan biosynthesis protein MviN/MurJ (putative lipid II flippase)
MSRHITKFLVGGAAFLPVIAFAQTVKDTGGFFNILQTVQNLLTAALPVLIALALLFFFWALAMFLMNSGDEAARATARQQMIWGIIVLFILVSVWGLVNLLANTFDVTGEASDFKLPGVPS